MIPGIAAFVGASAVAGVVAAGLAVPVVAASGQVATGAVGTFNGLPVNLDRDALPQRTTIRYADGAPMATLYSQNRVVVPLDQIAPVMREALVSIEDSRFYEHGGVDPEGIVRAAVNNASGDDTQGASTLTQQWIKNVLIQQAVEADDEEALKALQTPDVGRKIREIRLAIAVETRLSKDQILENYLNIVNFGSATYGVEAAAQHYFSKSAKDLSLADAALLAGLVQSPGAYEPTQHPEAATARRNVVLDRMLELGKITQKQHDAAVATPLSEQLHVQNVRSGCLHAGSAAYFCDYVTRVLADLPALGDTPEERHEALYGGLDITTTLQRDRQKAAAEETRDAVPEDDPSGVATSLVSVEPRNGHIVAMAQNKDYTASADASSSQTAINYNVDKDMGGGNGFQVGSTYKPFTLMQWLRTGHTLSDEVNAPSELVFPTGPFGVSCKDADIYVEPWEVHNSEGEGQGDITVAEATYNSVNTAYANMATELDLCDIREVAESLGVHQGDGSRVEANPSSVIGTNSISPLTMAEAYTTLANSGTHCTPVALLKVTRANGSGVPVQKTTCDQPLGTGEYSSQDIAATAVSAMEHVFTEGTAESTGGIGRPAAGKTGTTDRSKQTWFDGFTPELVTVAWVGTPTPRSMRYRTIAGEYYSYGPYGGTIAAPMWKAYMERALEGVPATDFADPDPELVGPDPYDDQEESRSYTAYSQSYGDSDDED